MTLTDPYAFTEPVVLDKFWLWFPEVVVEYYDCIPDERFAERRLHRLKE